MEIEQHIWGFTPQGEVAVLYTMTNAKGASVQLTNIGAGIVSVRVPDREGRIADVALGYASFEDYLNDGPCMGKTPGRYANRIAEGRFTLEGTEYRLARNNGRNHLHGGPTGFQTRLWNSRVETDRVVFSLVSPDGDEKYPGELTAEVCYDWNDDCTLEIGYYAAASAPTVINLTNHAYFNLRGEERGGAMSQRLQLNASRFLDTDSGQIPTGELVPVAGTPMDFTRPKALDKEIEADYEPLRIGAGYDHCWALDGWREGELCEAGSLFDPESGRILRIRTDQPGIQVYTGNWLQGCPTGKSGREYDNRDGVALECQAFPDSPNHPEFPSALLRPGEVYRRTIVYAFDTVKQTNTQPI